MSDVENAVAQELERELGQEHPPAPQPTRLRPAEPRPISEQIDQREAIGNRLRVNLYRQRSKLSNELTTHLTEARITYESEVAALRRNYEQQIEEVDRLLRKL